MIKTSMTTEMGYYEAYKASGADWIEGIPISWETKKLRSILSPVSIRNRADLPLLSVVREKGIILRNIESKADNHNVIPDDLTNYKVVKKGQFAMNKMKAWQGSYGVSNYDGIVSPAYFVFDLKGVSPKFFHIALRSRVYVPFFTKASDGVRVGQWDLSQTRMKEIPFWVPPLKEQEAIVRYLDHTTLKIDRAVRSKKKVIAALNEQKQAIITQAVTHGLNQDVLMKDSGVKWLGEIPSHWEMRRLRQIASMRVSNVDKHSVKGQPAVRLCNYVDVYKNDVIKNDMSFMEATASKDEVKSFKLYKNDVVITKDSEDWKDIGVPAFVESTADDLVCGYHLAILRPNLKIVEGAYLFRMLLTPLAKTQFGVNANGITRYGLTQNGIKGINICLPPLDEQREIVAFLDRETAAIDKTIELTKKEIALLQEYKTRLIADSVTGAIDVRELAKDLPDIEMEAVSDDIEVDEMDDVEEEMEE